MTTHDFRPGDVVEWGALTVTVTAVNDESVCVEHKGAKWWNSPSALKHIPPRTEPITIQRPGEWSAGDAPAEHPSRSRAASSLRAASASLTTAIDHLTRAGEAETYPGQTVIRTRTAAEETKACIHHATIALYWLLHERLGS